LNVEKLTQSLQETGSYGFLFLPKNRFALLKNIANRNGEVKDVD